MTVSISTQELKDWQTPWTVVRIKGRIDAFNNLRVIKSIEQVIQSGRQWICLDLTDVEFMSFQAMQEILKLSQSIRTERGDIVLVAPTGQVRRHLDSFTGHRGLKVFRNYNELRAGVFFVPRAEFGMGEGAESIAQISL